VAEEKGMILLDMSNADIVQKFITISKQLDAHNSPSPPLSLRGGWGALRKSNATIFRMPACHPIQMLFGVKEK
jgi:hypothetical protein